VIRNNDYRDLAVFTIVQDEPEFIHPWVNHYKKHVAEAGDVYVLVHPPTGPDGELMKSSEMPAWRRAEALLTEHHGVVLIPVHHTCAFDHQWLCDTVGRFQSFLLQSYDWVLFAEADEFVLPTPRSTPTRKTLLSYVVGCQSAACRPCHGLRSNSTRRRAALATGLLQDWCQPYPHCERFD